MYEIELGPCVSCGRAQECLGRLGALQSLKAFTGNIVIDPILDAKADLLFDGFKSSGMIGLVETLGEASIDSPAELVTAIRKMTAEGLENFDEQIEEEKARLDAMTENCEGALKMLAKKAGRTVTATICNSPQLPDGHSHETVIVDRKS